MIDVQAPPSAGAPVLAECHDAVMLLTLNRPDRLNAWNDELEAHYFALLDEAEDDPGIRAIVVTGAGRGFCARADLGDLEQLNGTVPPPTPRRRPRTYPTTLRKPLVAAINGPAAGLGLVEALYCDVRFCTPQAKLTTAFSRRGLVAEYGVSWLLARIVGPGRALDLLLSGRVVLGDEAHAIGLVDHLAQPEAVVGAALAYAAELASSCSPASMAAIKRQLRDDLDRSFEAAVDDADRLLIESLQRPDVLEGVASHLERRHPEFPALPARS
jgi:enoyl-CoA hydratase/carnithine racemase